MSDDGGGKEIVKHGAAWVDSDRLKDNQAFDLFFNCLLTSGIVRYLQRRGAAKRIGRVYSTNIRKIMVDITMFDSVKTDR